MKVSLINYTGFGHPNPLFAAALLAYTKNTRLEQGQEGFARFLAMDAEQLQPELDYIANTIRSSWEFIDFQFQIEDVTRAFTHQFVRTRTASYAQQTQRMVNVADAGVLMPESVANNPAARQAWEQAVVVIMEAYKEMQDAGIANQDCRGIVPTNILTNITAKINLRTLADLVAKRDNIRAQGEYTDVVRAMVKCVLEVMPWTRPFLYPERTNTPALDNALRAHLNGRSPTDVPAVAAALKELDQLKGAWG